MTLDFINWITAANWLQGSMKLQTLLSNKHQFVPTHDFTWTFKACYMHSGTTSESISEQVSSETDCSKEPNRNDSLFQSWPTQTASGCALRMRSAVLRAAFCWRDEGSRFMNNRPRCWWEKRGYTATHGVRECHGRKLFSVYWLWGKEALSHWVGSLFLTWRHNCRQLMLQCQRGWMRKSAVYLSQMRWVSTRSMAFTATAKHHGKTEDNLRMYLHLNAIGNVYSP